jgi:hypothetical protein
LLFERLVSLPRCWPVFQTHNLKVS